METSSTPSDHILRPADVASRLAVSRPTLWRMRQRGEFPAPIRLSRGAVGWRSSTVERWLNDREAEANDRGTLSPNTSRPGDVAPRGRRSRLNR